MKRGSYIGVGLSVGISMAILFGGIFCKVLDSYAGIGVGLCFGVSLGCLTELLYKSYARKK